MINLHETRIYKVIFIPPNKIISISNDKVLKLIDIDNKVIINQYDLLANL